MVDYNNLKAKFPAKSKPKEGKSKKIAKEQIRREFAKKKDALSGGLPKIKRGFFFYMILILGLVILGSFVLSATGHGGKAHISKAQINARKSMDALAVALGRYKFHVGSYPSTEEGLAALTNITPKVVGWNGPYCKRIVNDPWGRPYFYERLDSGHPILYSLGPDGKMGSIDDIMPDQALFDEPFRDTTWTNNWVPYKYRGILVAPNEESRQKWMNDMKTGNFER